MKSSPLIGKPENLYVIFFIDNQNYIFPLKLNKNSAIPLSMNALATPSEPKNPSNIKSSFDTALFYSMMYWDNDLEIVNNKSDLSVVLDYVLCITAAQGWCSLREEVGMFCHCFYFLF